MNWHGYQECRRNQRAGSIAQTLPVFKFVYFWLLDLVTTCRTFLQVRWRGLLQLHARAVVVASLGSATQYGFQLLSKGSVVVTHGLEFALQHNGLGPENQTVFLIF